MDLFNLDELKTKLVDLEAGLSTTLNKSVKCYFYMQNTFTDTDKLTLLIFEQASKPEDYEMHRINISSECQFFAESVSPLILQKTFQWLDNMSVIKRRQIERTRQFKEELVKNILQI
jgi:hypothetical protein